MKKKKFGNKRTKKQNKEGGEPSRDREKMKLANYSIKVKPKKRDAWKDGEKEKADGPDFHQSSSSSGKKNTVRSMTPFFLFFSQKYYWKTEKNKYARRYDI